MMNKDFTGIDLIKLIMAFAVIAIHAPEYLWPNDRVWPSLFEYFIRLAVPFFFIASGYLIERNLDNITTTADKKDSLIRRSHRIFKLWLIWSIIYLPLTIWGYCHSQESTQQKILSYLYDLILCGHTLYAQPLWFLYSMAIILSIWGYFGKSAINIIRLFVFFTIISYLLHIGIFQTHNNLSNIATWILGGGLPIIVGVLIRKTTKRNRLKSFKLAFISIGLLCLSILGYYFNLPFWTIIGGVGLLLIALIIHPIFKFDHRVLRIQSMWIYYTHMYVIMIYMVISHNLDFTPNRWLSYCIICCATWIVAIFFTFIGKRPNLSSLNKLIR